MTKKQNSKKRFYLLIYRRMWQRWAWPCFLIAAASIALWWFTPRISIIYQPFRILALAPALIALVLLVYTFLARKLTWVQCRSNHLRIQTPFYPLVISYRRIKGVRPSVFKKIFNPRKEKKARLRWLRPYWGKTALVMDVSSYPFNKKWLRLWFSPYLLTPDHKDDGFVFLVDDWMVLSRQIDEFRIAKESQQAEKREEKLTRQTW